MKSFTLLAFAIVLYNAVEMAYAKGGGSSCSGPAKDATKNIQSQLYTSSSLDNTGRIAAWSGGGGAVLTIPTGSGHPFGGRKYGGGDRSTIYGSRIHGSGYPSAYATTSSNNGTSGRGFPYGMWPISWTQDEYASQDAIALRPGGQLAYAQVGSTDTSKWPGLSREETYTIVGDIDSVMFMMADLVDWCHATMNWPKLFPSSSSNSTGERNVIQYYRASSFALLYAGYNSTSSTEAFPPLPSNIASSSFLQCVNHTIGEAIPILDAPPAKKLSDGAVVGIVIAAIAAFLLLIVGGVKGWETFTRWRRGNRV